MDENNDRVAPPPPLQENLRDYFAAAALQGILSNAAGELLLSDGPDVAGAAYKWADAMLEARKR
jgi:hypothetical protein